jgi:hypothetical protein
MKQVSATSTSFTATFPYDQTLVEIVKEIPGRRWDKENKLWTFPLNLKVAEMLFEILGARGFGFTLEYTEAGKMLKGNLEASHAKTSDAVIPCPEGLEYLPFQKAGIIFAQDKSNVLFGDAPGCGKQQPVDTKVATRTGWREIGTLKVDDYVIGSNGKSTIVDGVFPQGVKPSYRVTFSDHSAVEAGPEHLWVVLHHRGGKVWERLTLTTDQLRLRPKLTRSWPNGRTMQLDLAKPDLYLPMLSAPAKFAPTDLPLPAYLVGQLLANGALSGCSPVLTPNPGDWLEIRGHLIADHVTLGSFRQYGSSARQILPGIVGTIRDLSINVLSGAKFIPAIYMRSSVVDRIALLQGLMDGDGSISANRNKVTYNSTSPQLAEDVRELVESLGGIASVRHYDRSHDNKPPDYQVRIRLPKGILPFRVSRKAKRYNPGRYSLPCRTVESVEYVRDVESVCIAVRAKDRLYVTEHYILTHNTIEAIGIINLDPAIKRVLVICPATAKINWQRELAKWLIRPAMIGVAKGDDWPINSSIVITNYDLLLRHHKVIRASTWDLLIVDEAAALKTPGAIRTQQVLGKWARAEEDRISRIPARRTAFLTGTPLLNRPIELWPLVKDAGVFKNWEQYVTRYCDGHKEQVGKSKFVWNVKGASNLDELQAILRSRWMIRRLKSEVMTELPPKRRQVIELPANGAAQAIREEATAMEAEKTKLADLRLAVEKAKVSDNQEDYDLAVAALRHGVMFALNQISLKRHETAVAKVPQVIEFIQDAMEAEEKIVVFGWHQDVLGAIHKAFPGSVLVTGDTLQTKRQKAIDSFQEDPETKMFIGSIGAAGVAINLFASSHVIFAELDWVPGNVTQAEDRTHRKGQKNAVLVQHLVLEGSLDATMARMIVKKQEVLDAALDDPIALGAIPVLPIEEPTTANVSRQRITAESLGLTQEEITRIHGELRFLASRCDGARKRDGEGFSGCDTNFGKWLAAADHLSPKMAAAAKRMLVKYKGQLGKE